MAISIITPKHSRRFTVFCLLLVACLSHGSRVLAADKPEGPVIENKQFKFRLIPRTAEQMAAFYEGRGFPAKAVTELSRACFFTAIIRNKSNTVIWLDQKTWRFQSAAGEFKRLDRTYWQKKWDAMDLSQASRSTFGWTLLPLSRNLQPNESVGGNLVLPDTEKPFSLQVWFDTGKDRRGSGINLLLKNIQCKHN